MDPLTFVATNIDFLIMFLGGVYATLLGYRILGKKEGVDEKWDAWYAKFGHHFKWLGPSLMFCAVLLELMRHAGN